MALRRILFQLHWIVGITVGLVLAVVGATGALLSFEQQLVAFIDRDARYMEAGDDKLLTPPELLTRIATAHPEKRVNALTIARLPSPSVRVTFTPSGERPPSGAERGGRGEQRYVNPYTGAFIVASPSGAEAFFRDVRQLHRWLMLGDLGDRDIGRQIVGASTMLLLFMAFTGLYLRWPRGPAARRWRTWLLPNFQLKGRAFLWNLHSVIGTWVLPIYVVIALTGLQWSYEWYRSGFYSVAGVERPAGGLEGSREQRGAVQTGAREQRPAAMDIGGAWSAFERVTAASFASVNINLSARADRTVEFRYLDARPSHDRAFNTLAVDARGEIIRHERYQDKKLGAQLVASIFPLHSGSYFGLIGTVLFLLASLAMPLFSLTGWIMYMQRRTSRVRRLALATVADEA
jgi:sulfite reductase (NADPH) flavoprotein alpha-component